MDVLWVTLALLVAGFAGWPVTAVVFRLARTIDDRADAGRLPSVDGSGPSDSADGPSAYVAVDGEITVPATGGAEDARGDGAPPSHASPGGLSAGAAGEKVPSTRILRGGAIIGILERLAVCLAILGGQPVAIAYVVAIKGLGRFAELKETPVAAERFIIGTLTSMLWAAGIAALAANLFLS